RPPRRRAGSRTRCRSAHLPDLPARIRGISRENFTLSRSPEQDRDGREPGRPRRPRAVLPARAWGVRHPERPSGPAATRSGLEPPRLDPVLDEFLAERIAVDAEDLCRPHLIAAGLPEYRA